MTNKQKAKYWREYARQNAIYERRGEEMFLVALIASVRNIIVFAKENGLEEALRNVDSQFDQETILKAYVAFYLFVGKAHRKWEMKLWDTKFGRSLRIPRPLAIQEVTNSSVVTFSAGFRNEQWVINLQKLTQSLDVAVRVTQVSETTKKEIRKVLADLLREEVRQDVIAERLYQHFNGSITRQRARLIARTETTYITNVAAEQAAKEIAEENGLLLTKQWVATLDDRTRDTHRMVGSSQPIKAEDKFLVGGKKMDKPGDPAGGAAEVCNCRCIAAYFPADDYQDLFGMDGFIS